MISISDLKARYPIAVAWRDLGLAGEPAKCGRSPFPADHRNGDAHPSFSVFADGGRWKDQATGEGGDVLDLVKKARGCDTPSAIAWVRERLGIADRPGLAPGEAKPWPELRPGTSEEHAQLAELRHVSVEAVQLAVERGFLHFGQLWGLSFWAITDRRRKLVEFRRLDGEDWPAYGHLAKRKCHCMGSGKDWPIGTLEAEPYKTVVWLEGAPDFLTFWHLALNEQRTDVLAPVAMLGAANKRVAAEALAQLKDKLVVFYPHADKAGAVAMKEWVPQVRDAGAKVAAFDLSGIERDDGTMGKDLNDLCFMSSDCYHDPANYRFWEVLP